VYAHARNITQDSKELEAAYEVIYGGIMEPETSLKYSVESMLKLTSQEIVEKMSPFARRGVEYDSQAVRAVCDIDRTETILNELQNWIEKIPFEDLSPERQERFFAEVSKTKHIQILRLKGARYLTDENVNDWKETFKDLSELYLDGCDRIHVGSLLELIHSKPTLKLVLGDNKIERRYAISTIEGVE